MEVEIYERLFLCFKGCESADFIQFEAQSALVRSDVAEENAELVFRVSKLTHIHGGPQNIREFGMPRR